MHKSHGTDTHIVSIICQRLYDILSSALRCYETSYCILAYSQHENANQSMIWQSWMRDALLDL